jgi:hypothetical protein
VFERLVEQAAHDALAVAQPRWMLGVTGAAGCLGDDGGRSSTSTGHLNQTQTGSETPALDTANKEPENPDQNGDADTDPPRVRGACAVGNGE